VDPKFGHQNFEPFFVKFGQKVWHFLAEKAAAKPWVRLSDRELKKYKNSPQLRYWIWSFKKILLKQKKEPQSFLSCFWWGRGWVCCLPNSRFGCRTHGLAAELTVWLPLFQPKNAKLFAQIWQKKAQNFDDKNGFRQKNTILRGKGSQFNRKETILIQINSNQIITVYELPCTGVKISRNSF
jgi:hypothetical protein